MSKQTNVLLVTVPTRKGTETVYSELQNSPHGEFNGRESAMVHRLIVVKTVTALIRVVSSLSRRMFLVR